MKPSVIFLNGPNNKEKRALAISLRKKFTDNACVLIDRKELITMFGGYETADESHEWLVIKIIKNIVNNGAFVIFDGFLPSRRIQQYVTGLQGLPCYWIGVFFKDCDNEFYDFSVQMNCEYGSDELLEQMAFHKDLSESGICDVKDSIEAVLRNAAGGDDPEEASEKIMNHISKNEGRCFPSTKTPRFVAPKREIHRFYREEEVNNNEIFDNDDTEDEIVEMVYEAVNATGDDDDELNEGLEIIEESEDGTVEGKSEIKRERRSSEGRTNRGEGERRNDRSRSNFGKNRDNDRPRSFMKKEGDESTPSNSESGERPRRSFGDRPRTFGGNRDGDRPRSFGGGDRSRRSFGDGDRPRTFIKREGEGSEGAAEGGERPRRSFGDRPRTFGGNRDGDRSRSFGGGDRSRSSFGGSRDGDRPRRSFGDGDRPRTFIKREGEGSEGAAEGGERPRRSFGDRPRTFGGNRDGDRSRSFGGGDRSRSSFGGSRDGDRPRRSFGDGDRPRTFVKREGEGSAEGGERPRRSFGDRPRTFGGSRDGDRPRSFGSRDGGSRFAKKPRSFDKK